MTGQAYSVTLESRMSGGGPFAELKARVDELEERGGNLDRVAPAVTEEMTTRVLERFDLESGFEQGPWPALSDTTLALRRASKSPKMLRDTGILFASITGYTEGSESMAYTNNPYAKYHFSHEPRRVIPLRDAFDIDLGEVAEYAAELVLGEMTEL